MEIESNDLFSIGVFLEAIEGCAEGILEGPEGIEEYVENIKFWKEEILGIIAKYGVYDKQTRMFSIKALDPDSLEKN